MKHTVVIGGGFAGLAALQGLTHPRCASDITLIDKKETFDFLPMLPDIIGRGIAPKYLTADLVDVSLRKDFRFINEEVLEINFKKKEVRTSGQNVHFDYLVLASGSETNFYGNEDFRRQARSIDSVEQANGILAQLKRKDYSYIIVCGGGYTGIEVATNTKVFLDKHKRAAKVIVVERAASILGPLPEWMKGYIRKNLGDLDIEVCVESAITSMEADKVVLSNGRSYSNALVIWAAGVKTAGFLEALPFKKNQQGRLFVDEHLRVDDACFAVGDAVCFRYRDGFLRMAVQFAIAQGLLAGQNIARLIQGLPLKKYKPVDFGYIVPMANNRACGIALGLNMTGILAIMIHYCMCAYRSYGFSNKVGVLTKLNGGGRI